MPELSVRSKSGWRIKTPESKRVHQILPAAPNDWCHVCGYRMPQLVAVDTWENAEHALTHPSEPQRRKHIRICSECLGELTTSLGTGEN